MSIATHAPAYLTKEWEDITAEEQAEFDRDAEDARYEYEASQGPEFPRGEFAPQCNIGPLYF